MISYCFLNPATTSALAFSVQKIMLRSKRLLRSARYSRHGLKSLPHKSHLFNFSAHPPQYLYSATPIISLHSEHAPISCGNLRMMNVQVGQELVIESESILM